VEERRFQKGHHRNSCLGEVFPRTVSMKKKENNLTFVGNGLLFGDCVREKGGIVRKPLQDSWRWVDMARGRWYFTGGGGGGALALTIVATEGGGILYGVFMGVEVVVKWGRGKRRGGVAVQRKRGR